eukprot:5027247-Pyramimonas_sp.AAC.1
MEGGWFSTCGSRLIAARIRSNKLQHIHGLRAAPFSTCGSRLSAAHIRFKHLRELHGLRATSFQNVDLALARRMMSREWRPGAIEDCQDATVRLIRGGRVAITMF